MSLISADQILAHLWGDYLLQSHFAATEKTRSSRACLLHVALYTPTFLLFKPSIPALILIAGSHFLIDRYRLARYVVWAKNWICPWWRNRDEKADINHRMRWATRRPTATGYPPSTPEWLAFDLLIVADNILHLTLNAIALKYL